MHFATDMGWIMGPWTLVGVGALGGTIVFAEGAPDWPTPDRLWRTVEAERVTSLGLSPTLARALLPHGDADRRPVVPAHLRHDGRAVEPRAVPLALRGRRRVARAGDQLLGRHRGRRLLPLAHRRSGRSRPARSAGRRSGWRWTSSTSDGASLVGTGEVGELVCRRPFPGMTRGFWRDPQKYLDTYWSRIPGVWVHGDWASVDADGFWFLHGRSDDTLNIAGKRIGPAELESAAVGHPGRARGRRDRRAARGEGRDRVDLLLPAAGRRAERRARARGLRRRSPPARQGVHAGSRPLRGRAAEDALGEDRAPRRARDGARQPTPATSRRSRTPSRSMRSRRPSHDAARTASARLLIGTPGGRRSSLSVVGNKAVVAVPRLALVRGLPRRRLPLLQVAARPAQCA